MAARSSRTSGRFLTVWLPAAVVVPALLAGVALAWPGARIADDVGGRAAGALAAVGLGGVAVHASGRDVALAGVPAGAEDAALAAVAAVAGVRAAVVEPGSAGAGLSPATGPAQDAAPTATPPDAALPPERRALADRLAGVVEQAPVTFAADSAELTGAPAATATRVAALLAEHPDVPIVLRGFAADTPGPPEVAVALSLERARIVAAALVAGGVAPARITSTGLGATQPLDTSAASRRVEIGIR